ncbi:alpha-(1,3)-fucosyltransferase 10 [Protopterus annectens]|uniref:alpha-(1,3)-fucosyltransferase 10 n=1 Tax=Protopterus annectens TaxID=7888 RepID=UPI001CF9A494|nr:alpha-(1,3)-fucosyltransferase 10 [Protopterus annectens]XP_043914859.1 alpha-(1,3)-fucosyltransferase 10 [Protopterus annectens]
MARLKIRKLQIYCLCLTAFFFLLMTLQVVLELGQFENKKTTMGIRDDQSGKLVKKGYEHLYSELLHKHELLNNENIFSSNNKYPIMLWWSPLTGETGRLSSCGTDTCFFTINRTYQDHPMTKAFLFYGTDFSISSLPLPRLLSHEWALFHEESPKNNFKLFHEAAITLFNHTATFSQRSHLPLITQHLDSLEALSSTKYVIPLSLKNSLRQKLAPVIYVQSDCNPPSDRDSYIRELMKYIKIDSYGECLRNKELPQHLKDPSSMDENSFFKVLAQYKFTLAFENAVCEDYITEKLWRPLKLGVVPIYYGSPNIEEWLPSNKSAILVHRFSHPRELAKYIKELDRNDKEYETYLEWKQSGNISNNKLITAVRERNWSVQDIMQDNYIDAFECMVCNRVSENIRRKEKGMAPIRWTAEANHLRCPQPQVFNFSSNDMQDTSVHDIWIPSYEQSKKEARALRQLVERNKNFTSEDFWKLVFQEAM